MSELTVKINGRDYLVGCDDGQEDQLRKLARYVDAKMAKLTSTLGQIGDARLLVMASLMIADELSDAFEILDAGGAEAPPSEKDSAAKESSADQSVADQSVADQSVAATLEACAQRIEDIATRLERA